MINKSIQQQIDELNQNKRELASRYLNNQISKDILNQKITELNSKLIQLGANTELITTLTKEEQLEQLNRFFDKGIISTEEYLNQKQQIQNIKIH